MAFTENYAILNDCPLFWDDEAMAAGYYVPRFHRDMPTRLAVIPRRGSSAEIMWFEADPTFVLHWINAYEDGDEIVLDGFFETNPAPDPEPGDDVETMMFRYLDMHRMLPRAHRWRLNLKTGATTEVHLSDRTMEFGMINNQVGGKPYRFAYNASRRLAGSGFTGWSNRMLSPGPKSPTNFPTVCSIPRRSWHLVPAEPAKTTAG